MMRNVNAGDTWETGNRVMLTQACSGTEVIARVYHRNPL